MRASGLPSSLLQPGKPDTIRVLSPLPPRRTYGMSQAPGRGARSAPLCHRRSSSRSWRDGAPVSFCFSLFQPLRDI